MDLVAYDTQHLPPEMLLDDNHPANDDYIRSVEQIQRMVVGHSATMKPAHVNIIKRVHAGITQAQTAEDLETTVVTVNRVVNSTGGKRLRALLAHYQFAIDGPNEAQRRNMLWRMAQKNETDEPKVAINAVAELNRMTIADYTRAQSTAPAQTTIIINQNILPKGVLDQ